MERLGRKREELSAPASSEMQWHRHKVEQERQIPERTCVMILWMQRSKTVKFPDGSVNKALASQTQELSLDSQHPQRRHHGGAHQ